MIAWGAPWDLFAVAFGLVLTTRHAPSVPAPAGRRAHVRQQSMSKNNLLIYESSNGVPLAKSRLARGTRQYVRWWVLELCRSARKKNRGLSYGYIHELSGS